MPWAGTEVALFSRNLAHSFTQPMSSGHVPSSIQGPGDSVLRMTTSLCLFLRINKPSDELIYVIILSTVKRLEKRQRRIMG